MSKKKTNDEFVKEVYDLVEDEYVFLESYQGATKKIKCLCNKYGHEWKVSPSSFLSGSRCPFCAGNVKKTNDEFLQEAREIFGDKYTFLEDYKNANKKITIRHNKCLHEYEVKPIDFLRMKGKCPKCFRRKTKKKNDDFFKKEVRDLVGEEYTFVDSYIDSSTKIKCIHNNDKCNHYEYLVRPNDFLKGRRCPKCTGKIKKTHEEFLQEFKTLVGDEYKMLCDYEDYKKKIHITHKVCGDDYWVSPSNFLLGSRCAKCMFKNKLKTNTQFLKEVNELFKEEYRILSTYKNSVTEIDIIHKKCGYKYSSSPNRFLQSNGCPNCSRINSAKIRSKTIIQFKEEVYKLVGDEYKILGSYKNARTKILIKHNSNKCKMHEYYATPDNFLRGKRCPICRDSRGELEIYNLLKKHNIKFTTQKKFKECKNIRPLPFDFYLNDLSVCVEYDGGQHFEPVDFFGGEEKFKLQQINDNIKNTYCKENNIPLLRIPYWDYDNIESILEKELVKYGLINVDISKSIKL